MSELTYRLAAERPSRKLCLDASRRIGEMEQALIELEAHFLIAHCRIKEPLLFHVQKALYGEEAALNLNPSIRGVATDNS